MTGHVSARVHASVAALMIANCGCVGPGGSTAPVTPSAPKAAAPAMASAEPLVAPARAARAISGTVLDANRRPIAGAIVVMAHEVDGTILYNGGTLLNPVERRADQLPGVGRTPGNTIGKCVTGADGAFRFEDVAAGAFTMIIVHPERGAQALGGIASPRAEPLEVTLDKPAFVTARIDGLPLDPEWTYVDLETESPWPNAQIALRMVRTGETNEFTAGPVPDGCQWRLVAYGRNAARGYASPLLAAPIAVEGGAHTRIALSAGGGQRITGTLLGPDGESMADAAVRARPRDPALPTRGAFTNADGAFSIDGLQAGEYQLEAVRHRLRSEIGCGNGTVDIEATRPIAVPLANPRDADLRIEALVRKPQPGDAARSFNGETVEGMIVDLDSYRGKVVLLDFWATWCVLCLADMKHIANLHAELQSDDEFAVIGISLDQDPRAVQRFLQRQRLPWPQLVLGPADRNPIARLYNVTSTPTTILIDRAGRIAATHVPGESLRTEVMRLLEAAPAQPQLAPAE